MMKYLDNRRQGLKYISIILRCLSNSLFQNINRVLIFLIPVLHCIFFSIFFSFGGRVHSKGCCMRMNLNNFNLYSSYITSEERCFQAKSDLSKPYSNIVQNSILDKYNCDLSQVPTVQLHL